MTISELLKRASRQLQSQSSSARLDVEVLLCHVLQQPRSYLFSWPERQLSDTERQQFQALLDKRLQGYPVAHLTGNREFWSLPLRVTPDTLIPRPETELLVEQVLLAYPQQQGIELADLGTGTGAIALAIASERPGWRIVATDRSAAALEVARAGSWCQPLAAERFHIIVSNPPYILANDPHLQQGDVRFEPLSALAAGDDGLDDIRHIATSAKAHLNHGGWLLFEHGYDQAEQVRALLRQNVYAGVFSARDLAGIERVSGGTIP